MWQAHMHLSLLAIPPQALQAQAHNHQQVLADLAKQHQELCARLAATATTEVELQQQLLRLNADKQALQQQVDKVRSLDLGGSATALGLGSCVTQLFWVGQKRLCRQPSSLFDCWWQGCRQCVTIDVLTPLLRCVLQLQSEVAAAAANALAVAQVQHEQQVMEAKAAQQQLLQEARQQTQQLQQQVQELQQQLLKQVGNVLVNVCPPACRLYCRQMGCQCRGW
jgi:hypothetical protein